MFNHAYTLLLNRSGRQAASFDFPAAELVPPDYVALRLPSALERVRAVLFGTHPDAEMLAYRAKQFLQVLRSTELEEYTRFLDPRVTYDVPEDARLVLDEYFTPRITILDGGALLLTGRPAAPDREGVLRHDFLLQTLTDTTVEVHRLTQPAHQQVFDVTFNGGYSQALDLAPTGYACLVPQAGGQWDVTIRRRPQWELGTLLAAAGRVGDATLTNLFGTSQEQPWRTFRNLWYFHDELPYRLSGMVLALIYRTEEVRRGQG